MSLRRLLLLPLSVLAFAFAAIIPAGAFERSPDAYENAVVVLDVDMAVSPLIEQAINDREEKSAVAERRSERAAAALNPIYALSLTTDGQLLAPSHYRRC